MRKWPSTEERRARLGIAAVPPPTDVRMAALGALAATAFGALFPGLQYRLRWVTRAGPRGIALNLVLRLGVVLAADAMMRFFAKQILKRRRIEQRLRKELGRPPWPGELHDAWLDEMGFRGDSPLR